MLNGQHLQNIQVNYPVTLGHSKCSKCFFYPFLVVTEKNGNIWECQVHHGVKTHCLQSLIDSLCKTLHVSPASRSSLLESLEHQFLMELNILGIWSARLLILINVSIL